MTSQASRVSMLAAVLSVGLVATTVAAVPESAPFRWRAWAVALDVPDAPPPPPRLVQPPPGVPRPAIGAPVATSGPIPAGLSAPSPCPSVESRRSSAARPASAAGATHHASVSVSPASGGISTAS
jgi:hypothetical protein